MKQKPKIFIISGPSGSGKTTLYKRLLKGRGLKDKLKKSISLTTRLRRHNEKNGRDYEFVSRAEFLRRKKNQEFLEGQNIFGYLYATSKENVVGILKQNKNVLLCVDVRGQKAIKKIFPKAISIFILPPTIAVLKNRLKGRLTEAKKDLEKRLTIAKQEIRYAKRYDYVIVNDHLKTALKKLKAIVMKHA
ncbi:MAG: guanylate kinase [Candidatus Omnitrophota bacterium]|nr:guanylate kinase [Candidatus Omnitrophota bacterium]